MVDKDKTVNGEYYRRNILPIFATKNKAIFQKQESVILMEDGAPAHTAKATMSAITNMFPAVWRDWPGITPVLNPIEHLWARLQDNVLGQPRPRTREELIRRVKQAWNSVTQDDTYNLVESLHCRIEQCLQNEGHSTNY